VDNSGNLYVADSNNGRVLRFPAPFASYPTVATLPPADLVLGQAGFTAQIQEAGNSTMVSPYGLAFSGANGLLVSDASLNRVLYFPFSANGTFAALTDNGKPAAKVFGQPDFVSKNQRKREWEISNSPLHVASDGEGRIYVADTGNSRVLIFPDPNSSFTTSGGQSDLAITGLGSARGVWVNPITDEIWIANTSRATCLRYAPFSSLYAGIAPNLTLTAVTSTLTLATDASGALYVADATNRVAIYYPSLQALNGANFLTGRALAPALMPLCVRPTATAPRAPRPSAARPRPNDQNPVPTVLGDIQVKLQRHTVASVLRFAGTDQLYVPSNAPTSGPPTSKWFQKSTGQVLAAGQAAMSGSSPGVFMQTYTGTTRQAAVLNEDNSINSATNPAQRGHLIQIYATGQGSIPSLPSDGVPATSSSLVTVPKGLTQVLIGACLLSEGTSAPLNCTNQPAMWAPREASLRTGSHSPVWPPTSWACGRSTHRFPCRLCRTRRP